MRFDTQKLIIELLNQELRRSNRVATLMYHDEVSTAREDFIRFMKEYRHKPEKK